MTAPANHLRRRVVDLAAPVLEKHGLLMLPIAFFDRFDRFSPREREIIREYRGLAGATGEAAARRSARAHCFADELYREVWCKLCPTLPPDGGRSNSLLWGAAVMMDQFLDEEHHAPEGLSPLRDWVAAQRWEGNEDATVEVSGRSAKALLGLLDEMLKDCRLRAKRPSRFVSLVENLVCMVDAELQSVEAGLSSFPDQRLRRILSLKSVPLCWAGFQSSLLGCRVTPSEYRAYRRACDVVGEALWIVDDLADLDEDLEHGVWNRTLWRLFDQLGDLRFREAIRSEDALAAVLNQERIVETEIDNAARLIDSMEAHLKAIDVAGVRRMFSFWMTSWLRVYA